MHKRLLWDEANLKRAVFSVIVGKHSVKKAASECEIPLETLRRHVIKARAGKGVEKVCGRPTVLTPEQEKELCDILKQMSAQLYGLSPYDTRRLVFDFCEKHGIKNAFNKQSRVAGRYWLEGFMKRHPDLSVKQAEATSIQRAIGFNRAKVGRFFEELKKILFRDGQMGSQIPASNIYNVDESGFTVCQKAGKVIAQKGKSVGQLTSAEKGKTVTLVCAVSATGVFLPPMFIFPRVRMKPSLLDKAPPGSVGGANKSGWINQELFTSWFEHFLKFVQPQYRPEPVLLLMDGHSSHTQNLDVIEKARANNVILLVFPSHCTHKLQPLDIAFFKSLNTYYNSEITTWLRQHPARSVTEQEMPELLNSAYGRAATVKNGTVGFAMAGIFPFRDDIFTDADFAACDALDRPAVLNMTDAGPSTSSSAVVIQTSSGIVSGIELDVGSVVDAGQLSATPNAVDVPDTSSIGTPSAVVLSGIELDAGSVVDRGQLSATPNAVDEPDISSIGTPSAVDLSGIEQDTDITAESGCPSTESNAVVVPGIELCAGLVTATSNSVNEPASVAVENESGAGAVPNNPFAELLISPKLVNKPTAKKRKVRHAVVVTASPYKNELLKCKKDKADKVVRQDERKKKAQAKKIEKEMEKRSRPKVESKICNQTSKVTVARAKTKVDRAPKNMTGLSHIRPTRKRSKTVKSTATPDQSSRTATYYCLFCSEQFVEPPIEPWIQCNKCMNWCHEACSAGESSSGFICDLCN